MAGKNPQASGISREKASERGKPQSGKKRNRLARAAAIVLLGSTMMSAEQGNAHEFERPFITVNRKPQQNARGLQYSESTQIAMKLAFQSKEAARPASPQHQEAYISALMLDIDRHGPAVAITDCGQCLCASCSTSVSTTTSISTTTTAASTTSTSSASTTITSSIPCDSCDGCCSMCSLSCLC